LGKGDRHLNRNLARRAVVGTPGPGDARPACALASREGRIRAGGVEKDVTFENVDDAVNAQVDAAYRAKCRGHAESIVDGITNAQARSKTLRQVPLA
jgi:hypothetical protein